MAGKTSEELFAEIIELDKAELEMLAAAIREKLGISRKDRTADVSADKDHPDPDPGYEVILIECGPHKLDVIKLIRVFSYRSLKDTKVCLDQLPVKIVNYCSDDNAFAIKKEFEKAGAVVQLERVWS
ncbi:MAG: ribosomal protein L7/L12 [Anaerolineaceae bacterium]|nr:ribosomal protein L7/L12 [Anaerolineaceae bacterium]